MSGNILPTGDYWVDFFDAQGALVDTGCIAAATMAEARQKAEGYLPLVKAESWRIVRVIARSDDAESWGIDA